MPVETQICPQAPFVLLENSQNAKKAVLLFEAPHELIQANSIKEIEPAFEAIERALAQGNYVAGFMNYELGLALEPKMQSRLPENTPLLWFGVFKDKTITTHQYLKDWFDQYVSESERAAVKDIKLTPQQNYQSYEKSFKTVQQAIKAGDIYQLNLTFKADVEDINNPLALYAEMRRKQPVAYASLIMTGQQTILSASPELFIENKDGWLETRPMKGTLKRAPTCKQDQTFQKTLQRDEKSRAENLMIVDLMRNDLSRISQTGSVTVEDLFKVETYQSLHQMISVIRAKPQEDLPLLEQMRAIFPPGSITGAPKIRAMELINEIEKAPRGIYTGAIGYFSPNRDYCFNVAIRTLELDQDGKGQMGIGSGLVYDSQPDQEYDECLLKMQFLTKEHPEFSLLETMAYKPSQGVLYKKEHSDRLTSSAKYFQIPFEQQDFEELLKSFTQNSTQSLRLRLLLNQNGTMTITASPLEAQEADEVWQLSVAEKPMHSANIYLYHKTTHRHFYDQARQKAQTKNKNIKEVIFLNERGEVTEGSFTNLFIKKDGQLYTPPISCGLLSGTLRMHMLNNGDVKEKILTLNDLETADQLYVGNSVRGLLKARLA